MPRCLQHPAGLHKLVFLVAYFSIAKSGIYVVDGKIFLVVSVSLLGLFLNCCTLSSLNLPMKI